MAEPVGDVRTTRRALLSRLLPDDKPDDLAVRQGQFHVVVIGSDRVVCLPRTRAAADRLPERAVMLHALARLDLGFRTPEPLVQGGVDEASFLVLSRIPGEPLETGVLDDARVAESVAAQYVALLSGLGRAGTDETVRAVLSQAPEDRWRLFAEDVRAELFQLMSGSGRLRAEREIAVFDFRGADLRNADPRTRLEDLDGVRWSSAEAAGGATQWPPAVRAEVIQNSVPDDKRTRPRTIRVSPSSQCSCSRKAIDSQTSLKRARNRSIPSRPRHVPVPVNGRPGAWCSTTSGCRHAAASS
ncbi:hypothetical protein GCM10022254_51820 [Actinomadura meridiana]|uniref:Aminoglycoside phosphotransferase domain-containing protein n=1 Tax=Actinomadura meridiana TaxID=559626 RepID=A0ABP8CDW6_9ACTN